MRRCAGSFFHDTQKEVHVPEYQPYRGWQVDVEVLKIFVQARIEALAYNRRWIDKLHLMCAITKVAPLVIKSIGGDPNRVRRQVERGYRWIPERLEGPWLGYAEFSDCAKRAVALAEEIAKPKDVNPRTLPQGLVYDLPGLSVRQRDLSLADLDKAIEHILATSPQKRIEEI
jgi:hypothetical protein